MAGTKPDVDMSPILHNVSDEDDVVFLDDKGTEGDVVETTDKGEDKSKLNKLSILQCRIPKHARY